MRRLQHPDGFLQSPGIHLGDGLQGAFAHRTGIARRLPPHERRHAVGGVYALVLRRGLVDGLLRPLQGDPGLVGGSANVLQGGLPGLDERSSLGKGCLRGPGPPVDPRQLFQGRSECRQRLSRPESTLGLRQGSGDPFRIPPRAGGDLLQSCGASLRFRDLGGELLQPLCNFLGGPRELFGLGRVPVQSFDARRLRLPLLG